MNRHRGATLIELMIAMLLGATALSVLASVVGMGVGANGKMLAQSRLKEELSSIMALMTRDVRRNGYFANTQLMVEDPTSNPSPFVNSLSLSAFAGEEANSCLVYSYDANENGSLDLAPDERFGFRLRDNDVEMRQGGLGCDDVGWQDLSDEDVVSVDLLRFDTQPVTSNGVTSNQITITIRGSLANSPAISRQYQETFLVRAYD